MPTKVPYFRKVRPSRPDPAILYGYLKTVVKKDIWAQWVPFLNGWFLYHCMSAVCRIEGQRSINYLLGADHIPFPGEAGGSSVCVAVGAHAGLLGSGRRFPQNHCLQ